MYRLSIEQYFYWTDMSKNEIYLTTFKANIIEIFSIGQKTEYAEVWRTYTPYIFILEILYANEYN